MMEEFKVNAVGVMSGTSLDGLDLCFSRFIFDGSWHYETISSACVEYEESLRNSLETAHLLNESALKELHVSYGEWIGNQVNAFILNSAVPADMICSHGHTVKHEPELGITLQIGSGQQIANITGITTVSDFRSLDVELGGQGAPLVPVGDKLLFSEYDACLNLGGFSNISFEINDIRLAFDICPVNIVLNPLASRLGLPYDDKGKMARSGNVCAELLQELNGLSIYTMTNRPSLSREWLEADFLPIVQQFDLVAEDVMRTLTEHSAMQIASVFSSEIQKVLITGGGAHNDFLIERIKTHCSTQIEIPEKQLVDFKEALVFAFLGVLRSRDEINVLKSVTGAARDSSSGELHYPRNRPLELRY